MGKRKGRSDAIGRGDGDVTTETSAQARSGENDRTDNSAQRGTTSRLMQITGRAYRDLGGAEKNRSHQRGGGRRKRDGRRACGDALAEERNDAAGVRIGIGDGNLVLMAVAVVVATGVQISVELGTDREDRQQQHQCGDRRREEAVREGWRTGVGRLRWHEREGKDRIMAESSRGRPGRGRNSAQGVCAN